MTTRSRITIQQTQRLSLNTQLISSIQMLGSDAVGLSRYLEEAAVENPQLVVEPARVAEWLPRWSGAFARLASGGAWEDAVADPTSPSLLAHVGAQMATLRLNGAEAQVADLLAHGLEPSGWLGRPLDGVAAEAGVPLAMVEAVLARLQTLEPTGIFARTLAECLRLQAEEAGWLTPLARGVLDQLALVAVGDAGRIARLLGGHEDQVRAVIGRIRGLDPKPGARFAPCAAPIREPDLIARKLGGAWEVALNRSALPALRLADQAGPGRAAARAVIHAVAGRNTTLLKVAREILSRQSQALDEGTGALQPMTMAEVAAATGLNQSTVSRAVAGVAVDTPLGTWWLRALFSQAIRGQGPAAASLREALARMVAAEDPTDPLSDEGLAQALAGAGAPVARRTVAKYRQMLGIPPTHRRRKTDRNGRSQR